MKNIIITIGSLLFFAPVFAQQKTTVQDTAGSVSFTAIYQGGDIILSYRPPAVKVDSVLVDISRKGLDGIKTIKTNYKLPVGKVSQLADTTIRKAPGIYEYTINAHINTGPLFTSNVWAYAFAADVRPLATTFKAVSNKGTNNITLSWSIANNYAMRSMVLMRGRKKTGDFTPVATLNNTDTGYVNRVDDSNEPFFYRLDMMSAVTGAVYSSATIFVIPEFKIIPLPVANVKAVQQRDQIVLNWDNTDEYARGFYIKKRTANRDTFITASGIILKNKTGKYEWRDSALLANNQMYQYLVLAESNSFDKSRPADTLTVSYVNSTINLSAPQDLRIIPANDSLYNLAWSVDSLRMHEMAGYVLYFKKGNETEFKPIGGARADINYVTITKPNDGDTYKVKAINGNKQSTFSLPYTYHNAFQKSFGPKYLKAGVINNTLHIKWLVNSSIKVKEYRLYKWNGVKFMLVNTIPAGINTIATPSYITGQLNIYKLKTVDINNIESDGSDDLQVN